MKAVYFAVFAVVAALFVTSVGVGMYFRDNGQKEDSDSPPMDPEVKAMELVLTVDGKEVKVAWEDNPSVDALKVLAKDTLTINMTEYGNFEQTGSIGRSIVSNDTHIDVGSGDVVLYNSRQVCLYFNDNSYDFTRLGKITGMTESEITEMLDKSGVTAVLTLK